MSSNDSTSSSTLSQFGLYRTIDARTEEFLKLSRKRQIRQGCACAAVSSAITVTVVVSVLFLYGYGVSSSSSAALRTTSWLDLMNDSTDTTPFDDKFQNSVKFDRASMNLLPVFFDKILEDQESSSPKYEVPTMMNYKRSIFPGSANPFLAQAKISTPGLYSIQYKTYPVLYIQSPRNTEYYMKVRKTREYERIMSYIDKMINEKVGVGTRSMRNLQYPVTTEKYTESSRTAPVTMRKTARLVTKPKENKFTKIILHSNKNSKQLSVSNMKYNNSMIHENKNCECRNHFGTLLDKILKCFQALVKDSSELPCKNKTQKKTAVEMKNQNNKKLNLTISTVATTRVRPVTTTTPSTTSTTSTKPTTTSTTTAKAQTETFTTTDFPPEIFHFSNSFLQKPAIVNNTMIKPKELLSQMSPFYIMTEINNPKNSLSNILAPIKPKANIFSTNQRDSKVIKTQNNNQQNVTLSITEKNVEKSIITTSTSTTTTSPEKSEEIYKNLLFPVIKELEFAELPEKAINKHSNDFVLRPRIRERDPPVIKPHTTTKPPTTSISDNLMQHQTDKHKKVGSENIISKINSRPHAPVLPADNKLFSGITPEDYIMERIRHGSKKQNFNIIKTPEPVTLLGYKSESSSNTGVFDKIKNLLKTKLMQPRRKTPYNSLPAQIMKSKTEPKYMKAKQTNLPKKKNISTEYVAKNYFETIPTSDPRTTVYNRMTTSTTRIPTLIEGSTSPTQLRKYPQEPFLPELTTQPSIKESNYNKPYPKLGRRNIPYNSREDIWGEDYVYKTVFTDQPAEIKITTAAPKNNSIPTTTTERVIHVKNSLIDPKEIEAPSDDIDLNKERSLHNNNKNVRESSQTDDNYTPYKYMIPVGRKSYLEISRGDWKQKEPLADDTNAIYDALDEMDAL